MFICHVAKHEIYIYIKNNLIAKPNNAPSGQNNLTIWQHRYIESIIGKLFEKCPYDPYQQLSFKYFVFIGSQVIVKCIRHSDDNVQRNSYALMG